MVDPILSKNATPDLHKGVISRIVFPAPDLFRGPGLFGLAPERIGFRQSERKKHSRTKIETPGRDIWLAHGRLMAAESDLQPSAAVERARRIDHSPDDRGERRPHLCRRDSVGQLFPSSHIR